MFKKLLIIVTLAAGLISTQASAAFVSTDWKSTGDKLAVLDKNTGIEWLSLDVTRGWSLTKALDETKDGGSLAGWRLPSFSEVQQMIMSFYSGTHANFNGQVQQGHKNDAFGQRNMLFKALFGSQTATSSVTTPTVGLFYRDDGTSAVTGSYAHSTWNMSNFYGSASALIGAVNMSVFLVSDGGVTLSSVNDPSLNINNPNAPINTVDVPAPVGLAAAALLIFGAFRKFKGAKCV